MNEKPIFRWTVFHKTHGAADVTGADKRYAVIAAARLWGVPWTSIARECEVKRLGVADAEE